MAKVNRAPFNGPEEIQTSNPVLWISCPTCGETGPVPGFLEREWNGKTYRFTCGHEHHLDPERGGARSWLIVDETKENPGTFTSDEPKQRKPN